MICDRAHAGLDRMAFGGYPDATLQPSRDGLGFAWIPLAVAGGQTALSLFLGRKSGAQKRSATAIVDEAERLLRENLDFYLASDRSALQQAAAIDYFNQVWGGVVAQCGSPALGSAGERCINERKRGGVWDWFERYFDPIAQDEAAAASTAGAAAAFGFLPAASDMGMDWLPLGIAAGLAFLAVSR